MLLDPGGDGVLFVSSKSTLNLKVDSSSKFLISLASGGHLEAVPLLGDSLGHGEEVGEGLQVFCPPWRGPKGRGWSWRSSWSKCGQNLQLHYQNDAKPAVAEPLLPIESVMLLQA